jgi:asparagine synthase (glutamine-hydrolysing)
MRSAEGGAWSGAPAPLLASDVDACVVDGRPADADAVASAPDRSAGAFALARVDERGHLRLLRDAIGHRSLYWARLPDGSLGFSTRIRDLLARGVPRVVDPVGVATYLSTAYVPGERTLVAGVRAVPPGVELVFAAPDAEPVRRPFWQLPAAPAVPPPDEALRVGLRELLEAVVGGQLPAGPVGASLSGGIDSSLVVALARRLGAPLTAFSISFGPPHRDELAWSSLVARHVGARHEVLVLGPDDVRSGLDRTVGALSEPNGDPLTVPNERLFAAAASHGLGVVLNGEGGDPCFGGPKNAPMLLSELYGSGALLREQAYLRAHQKLWDELDAALHPDLRAAVPPGALEALVSPWFTDPRWPSFLDRLLAINVAWKGSSHILPKVEHLGGLHGVAARSPLFDRRVVDLAFHVPARLKRSGPNEKHLLKAAVRDLLPAEIVDRPKSGMMVPVEAWFSSAPLEGWARERILDGLAPWGVVDRGWAERLLDRRTGGLRPRRGVKIWLLVTLESWLRTVLRGAA